VPKRSKGVIDAVNAADARIESMTGAFSTQLNQILMKAQAKTLAVMQGGLTFGVDGRISRTPENRRHLSKLEQVFRNEMRGAGYDALVNAYVGEFPGLIPYFQQTVNAIFMEWREMPALLEWGPADLQLTIRKAASTASDLQLLVGRLGAQAQAKALLSFNALRFSDLTEFIARHTGQTLPQARSVASTATANYYRAIADTGFQRIEETRPGLLYTYEGPNDILTRPFCERVLMSDRSFSRAEIEGKLENWAGHSLPNVMVTCGGYNCRHQWILYRERPGIKGKKRR
jgi:hypothetical protein